MSFFHFFEFIQDYFGLAPGKTVGLKYAYVIVCNSYDTDSVTGEREGERERVCVGWIERERECVCVCVCVRERERYPPPIVSILPPYFTEVSP